MRKTLTFEEAYPQQPFAELVRLGIWLGEAIRRHRDGHRDGGQASPTVPARA